MLIVSVAETSSVAPASIAEPSLICAAPLSEDNRRHAAQRIPSRLWIPVRPGWRVNRLSAILHSPFYSRHVHQTAAYTRKVPRSGGRTHGGGGGGVADTWLGCARRAVSSRVQLHHTSHRAG